MKRKIISLLLILILCSAVIGCGKEKDSSDLETHTTVENETSETAGIVETEASTEEDAEGKETNTPSMEIRENYEIEIDDDQGVGSL